MEYIDGFYGWFIDDNISEHEPMILFVLFTETRSRLLGKITIACPFYAN